MGYIRDYVATTWQARHSRRRGSFGLGGYRTPVEEALPV
jgi:hypothetical protein